LGKLKSADEIEIIVGNLKLDGQVIGFTNGCFDILHAGHTQYLKKAKELCDVLIIGLNSDNSVKRIKGEKRPINCENDRALVLSSLEFVDYVVIFEEDTPNRLIKKINPDILIKGADWKGKEVAGCDFVKEKGGECKFIDFLENRSTTNIIEKVLDAYCSKL